MFLVILFYTFFHNYVYCCFTRYEQSIVRKSDNKEKRDSSKILVTYQLCCLRHVILQTCVIYQLSAINTLYDLVVGILSRKNNSLLFNNLLSDYIYKDPRQVLGIKNKVVSLFPEQ